MDHALVQSIEKTQGWTGANGLGAEFARGHGRSRAVFSRLLTPQRLLDVVMRRSLPPPQVRCFEHGTELPPDAYLARQVTRRGQSLPVVNMSDGGHRGVEPDASHERPDAPRVARRPPEQPNDHDMHIESKFIPDVLIGRALRREPIRA